jgi:type II secretory pathway component PulF
MVRYFYRVKNKAGQTSEGTIEAESESAAIEQLSGQGYFIIALSEQKLASPTTGKPVSTVIPATPARRVGVRELGIFTRQLADLINAGVTLVHALDIIRNQLKRVNPGFAEMINTWYQDIQGGMNFSQAIEKFKDYLPSVLPALVASGEASGNLDKTLRQAADLFEKEHELHSKVKGAMIYPSLVAIMGAVTVFVLLSFVIPKISSIFVEMGQALPFLTRILISVSNMFARLWWVIIIAIAGAIFSLRILLSNPQYKLLLDQWKLSFPLIKKLTQESELARFARILGMLFQSGVPILEAIEVTIPVLGTEVYKGELKTIQSEIKAGRSLTSTMANENLFPAFAKDMLKVGEESGKLDDSLIKVAESYERSLEYTLKILTDLLEPILILAVGAMIGLIVIGMLLPIFQLNLIIK